jgi:hypothetical protein
MTKIEESGILDGCKRFTKAFFPIETAEMVDISLVR